MHHCSRGVLRRLRSGDPGQQNASSGRGDSDVNEMASTGGAALLIVLAMVVLMTGLAVAYLSRTTSDRQVAHSSFHQSKVDVLAQSAMDIVIGDLQQEITNGSTAVTEDDGTTVYIPRNTGSGAAANMIPQRRANAAGAPNLIRVSVRSDSPTSPGVGSRASAVNSRTDASANSRFVTSTRWNGHYLVPKGNTATADSSPIPAFTNATPDWVFVAPDPDNPTQDARKIITSPNQLVIGRYAYAIYDQGSLLDMNVAGYPTDPSAAPVPTQRLGRKGSVAFADLSALGSYPFLNPTSGSQHTYQIDMLVGWRNYATTSQSATNNNDFPNVAPSSKAFARNFQSAGPTTSYYNYVFNNAGGFLAPTPTVAPNGLTDQVFLGRKQMIAYEQTAATNANNGNTVASSLFDVNALQYLSTFSREINAPSFSPATPTAINPSFLLVRVAGSFTRLDGTTAVVGEPLVKTRFPLSRLAWITFKGPSASLVTTDPVYQALINAGVSTTTIAAGTAGIIKKSFGLVWDSRAYVPATATTNSRGQQWVYTSPSSLNSGGNFDPNSNPGGSPASDIKTLATVASENREPDFFELLRATILDGSLGQNTGGGVTAASSTIDAQGANTFPDLHMSNKALHILSIGASIIDQADPDSIPTRVQFNRSGASVWWTAYGVESLPYITEIYPIGGVSPAVPNNWATYLLFQVWNPHIGAALPTPAPQTRLRVDGNIGIFSDGGSGRTWTNTPPTNKLVFTIPPTGVSVTQIPLTTVGLPPGSTPAPLSTPAPAATAPPVGSTILPGFERLPPPATGTSIANYIGLRLPDFPLGAGVPAAPVLTLYFGTDPAHQFNATMEYTPDAGTTWVPYNHFIGIIDRSSTIGGITGSWMNGASVPVRAAGSLTGLPNSSPNRDQFNAARLTDFPVPDCLMKADPRATRFGIFQFKQTLTSSTARIVDPLWPAGNLNYPNGYGGPIADPAGPVEHAPLRFVGLPYFPATLCINSAASTSTRTAYTDADGIIRPADAVYPDQSVATTGSSTPYYLTGTAGSGDYHPIILNRPFRNVGELGYAFRDLPWKTLDFFTDKSADAGLLDVFTITDGVQVLTATNDIVGVTTPAIVAGRVNLNGGQGPVLQSILAGAILDELNPTSSGIISGAGTSATSAPVIAANIVTEVSMPTSVPSPTPCPLSNDSELVTRPGLLNYILPVPAAGAAHDQTVKSRREALVRALSSALQTRTWTLLIDVVAQTGRFKPNATNLQNDFVVEGEQHYWVHVAIDRFTGQVIDKQIEVVNE